MPQSLQISSAFIMLNPTLKDSSESAATNIYLFIGRPQAWPNDNSPTTPADNNDTAFNAYDDMVALKRVTSTDITHAVVRRDWVSGTTYDEYAHDYSSSNTANSGATSLFAATFYVLTDDYNVYKVINNDGNTASTVKPISTSIWLYHDCRWLCMEIHVHYLCR